MSKEIRTCGNCAHCIETSAGIDICSVDNTDVMGIEFESDIVARGCCNYEPKPEMTTFKVPVVWTMMGFVDVALPTNEQPTMADAIQYARENIDEFSLPSGEYLDGSFEIDESVCDLDDETDADEIEKQTEKIYLARQHKNDVEEVFDYAEWDRHGEFADNVGFAFSSDREDFLLSDEEVDLLATKIREYRNDGDSFEGAYEYVIDPIIKRRMDVHKTDIKDVSVSLDVNFPGCRQRLSDDDIECIAYRVRYCIDVAGMAFSAAMPSAFIWFNENRTKEGDN